MNLNGATPGLNSIPTSAVCWEPDAGSHTHRKDEAKCHRASHCFLASATFLSPKFVLFKKTAKENQGESKNSRNVVTLGQALPSLSPPTHCLRFKERGIGLKITPVSSYNVCS